ncbi:MAG: ferritin-like domain-containing protein [Thermoanaerobacterales bacterium]|nr:ferritin-like domain-containing protein [Bacillota bacterium]MDI6905863.1 ferritin-like domain-containing protein [Thermoanaerobacterales bacterium]
MLERMEVIRMLREALTDERTAIEFYGQMMTLAPNYESFLAFALARRDEQRHAFMIENLLERLTGRRPEPDIVSPPVITNFREGVETAIADEREAAAMYAEIIEMARTRLVREVITPIRIDELLHAQLFEGLLRFDLTGPPA